MKKIILIIITVIAAVLLFGIYQYNKPPKNILESKTDITFKSAQLVEKFKTNTQSNAELNGKIIEITGTVTLIEKSETITILILDDKIKCEVSNSSYNNEIKIGNTLTTKGLFSGYDEMFNEISLIKCYIINQ